MGIDIRLPNINAETTEGQMQQMKSYMYQLVQQLNWALNTINDVSEGNTENIVLNVGSKEIAQDEQDTFNSIKALIIKSADIIEAYYDAMKVNFDGEYVAKSDFGTFKEATSNSITANSTSISQLYTNIQTIITEVSRIIDTQAWINSGLLGYDSQGIPIYGVEVGQKATVDGVETFNKYARFTASGIYFYLPGINDPVAWMNGTKLYITNTEITGELKIAGFKIVNTNGLAFKWVGGAS